MKFKSLPYLAMLLLCCFYLQSCAPKPPIPGQMAMPVETQILEESIISDSAEYLATLKSRKSVSLKPRASGQVQQIYVQSGDQVSAGKLLLRIDSSKQQENVQGGIASVGASQADLSSARETLKSYQAHRLSVLADLKLSEKQYDRYSRLNKEELVSKNELDKYQNNLDKAKGELSSVDAQIQAQKFTINRAEKGLLQSSANTKSQQAELGYYNITAPFSGTVGDIPVKVGDYVDATTELTKVSDISNLEVYISVSPEQARSLTTGMQVQLINSSEQAIGNCVIFFISPTVDTESQTVLVKANFTNKEAKLKADEQIKCILRWNEHTGIKIPTEAVSRFGNNSFVFVLQDKKGKLTVQQRPVQLHEAQDNYYPIISGLAKGETIVTKGIEKLSDGAAVSPIKGGNK